MIQFDKEELLKIANLAALKLNEKEVAEFLKQIQLVLDYTKELDQVKLAKEVAPIKNVNVFRQDKAILKDSSNLLSLAPRTQDSYFVVPKILKN